MSTDQQQQDFNIDQLLSSCADSDEEERQQLDQRLLEATATKKRLSFQTANTPARNNSADKHTPAAAEGNQEESEQSAEDKISKTVKKPTKRRESKSKADFDYDAAAEQQHADNNDEEQSRSDGESEEDEFDFNIFSTEASIEDAVRQVDKEAADGDSVVQPRDLIMGLINLSKINQAWREVGENNCISIEQAYKWMIAQEPENERSQLKKLAQAGKLGGDRVQKEIQLTLTWLQNTHLWATTEASAMVVYTLANHSNRECKEAVDNTVLMFCDMGPRKVRRFMDHTTQGKLDPNCFERLQSASGSDGFEWLNPETKTRVEQKKTHTEIHHSQAWVVLVKGISDMLQKKTRPVQDVRTALSKWICENKQQTLLGNTVVGKWKKQLKGEALIKKINEEMSNWKELKRSATANRMADEIPSEASRVANLMAMPRASSTVRAVEKALARHKPQPIPLSDVTYERVVSLMAKHESSRREVYWLDEEEEPSTPAPKRNGGGNKDEKERLTRKEKRAISNYARTKKKNWWEVTIDAVKNDGGTDHWAERSNTQGGANPSAHPITPSEPEKKEGKKNIECTFYKRGACDRGDKCAFSHAGDGGCIKPGEKKKGYTEQPDPKPKQSNPAAVADNEETDTGTDYSETYSDTDSGADCSYAVGIKRGNDDSDSDEEWTEDDEEESTQHFR